MISKTVFMSMIATILVIGSGHAAHIRSSSTDYSADNRVSMARVNGDLMVGLKNVSVGGILQDKATQCDDGRTCEGNYFCCGFTGSGPDRWCCPFNTRCGPYSCV